MKQYFLTTGKTMEDSMIWVLKYSLGFYIYLYQLFSWLRVTNPRENHAKVQEKAAFDLCFCTWSNGGPTNWCSEKLHSFRKVYMWILKVASWYVQLLFGKMTLRWPNCFSSSSLETMIPYQTRMKLMSFMALFPHHLFHRPQYFFLMRAAPDGWGDGDSQSIRWWVDETILENVKKPGEFCHVSKYLQGFPPPFPWGSVNDGTDPMSRDV